MSPAKRVLLIDDDEDILLANRLALEAAGYAVETASSGEEGERRAKSGAFALTVLDVMMETRETGFEVARALRQSAATREMPLLMLTSVNEDASRRGGFLGLSDRDRDSSWLPVDRFVDKPVSPERLVGLVDQLLRR